MTPRSSIREHTEEIYIGKTMRRRENLQGVLQAPGAALGCASTNDALEDDAEDHRATVVCLFQSGTTAENVRISSTSKSAARGTGKNLNRWIDAERKAEQSGAIDGIRQTGCV